MIFMSSLVMLPTCLVAGVEFPSKSASHDLLVSQGKQQYEIISMDSRMPRFGPCWKNALSALTVGCKDLDDEVQSRLALRFANCFLEKAGLRTYPCSDAEEISDCLVNIDNNAFTTYANFFTHTQNMCYFLQSQVWQENTVLTVEKLVASSDDVSRSMENSHKLQAEILSGQEKTLKYHQELLQNSTHLNKAIEAGKEDVRDILAEFKSSTDEQKSLIFEVFNRVSKLQNLVLSEVNWLYTVVFYGACLLVVYIVTATKRTADARLILLIILSLNFCVERMICKGSLPTNHAKVDTGISETIYSRIWIVRQIAIALCVCILTGFVLKYKDYNVMNNHLLQEIKNQNLELKRSMEIFQVKSRNNLYFGRDMVDGPGTHTFPTNSITATLTADDASIFQNVEDELYTTDTDDSFDSSQTDKTFSPPNCSDEEFITAENSRRNSLFGLSTIKETEREATVRDLSGRNLSPIESRPSIEECTGSVLPSSCPTTQSSQPSSQPRVGRPPGSRTRTPTPQTKRYDLRSRRRSDAYDSPTADVEGESVKDFANIVKAQLNQSTRNMAKWRMAMRTHQRQTADYSSDDAVND